MQSAKKKTQAVPQELEAVSRLRNAQLILLLVVVAAIAATTWTSLNALSQTRAQHKVDVEVANELLDMRAGAYATLQTYWRSRAEGSGLPVSIFTDMDSIGRSIHRLVKIEQERDPNSPQAASARAAVAEYSNAVAQARDYLRSPGSQADQDRRVRDVMTGPVPAYFEQIVAWSDQAQERAGQSLDAQNARVSAMITWFSILGVVLLIGGLLVYYSFGRARKRLLDHFAEYADEQGALHRVARTVAESDDPEVVFQTIAEEVAHLLEADAGWLDHTQHDSSETVALHASPEIKVDTDLRTWQNGISRESAQGMALRTGKPTRVDDVRNIKDALPPCMVEAGLRTCIAAPVLIDGRPWGVVVVASRDRDQLPPGCEERLAPFARLAGVAIANARDRSLLAERASTDALTLLPNHGAFHQRLTEEVAHAMGQGTPLSLVAFDIDHFKAVNDTYGHPAGDRVLAEVARRISQLVRSGEMLARIGGEEFAWILPGAGRDEARKAAERARKAIRDTPFEGVGVVTISAGTCDMELAADAHDLLEKADFALLAAKEDGRDRTVIYQVDADRTGAASGGPSFEQARTLDALHSLARAINTQDPEAVDHNERVAETAMSTAKQLGWSPAEVTQIGVAARLHNVGKVFGCSHGDGTSSLSLGTLSAQLLGEVLPPKQVNWVRHHDDPPPLDSAGGNHEMVGAHILAAADLWDCLVHGTTKRNALPISQAIHQMRGPRSGKIDPSVVEALVASATMPHAGGSGS